MCFTFIFCVYDIFRGLSRGIFFCLAQFSFLGPGEGVKVGPTAQKSILAILADFGAIVDLPWLRLEIKCFGILLVLYQSCSSDTELKLSTVR